MTSFCEYFRNNFSLVVLYLLEKMSAIPELQYRENLFKKNTIDFGSQFLIK